MSFKVNKSILRGTTAISPAGMPSLGEIRQMQATPESIIPDEENDVLIIPIVALREGVFQCATCPTAELYLAEQFGRIAAAWNDRMVTIGHPQVNGMFVSAGTTGIWERDGIGRIKNARVDGEKLKVDAHIDMGKVRELGSDALDLIRRIERGEQIDVSIGAFVDTVPQSGFSHGKEFHAVQTNYVPDHLAILPVGVAGACSWKDGCGAPRVNAACACGGTETCQCSTSGSASNNADPALSDAQLGDRTKREMLTSAIATKERGFFFIIQVFDDHVVYRNDDEKTLRRDYTIDEATGTVTLSDEAIEGTLVSEFMPITVQKGAEDMDKAKAVNQLIANEASPWGEDDRDTLMSMADDVLAKVVANNQTAPSGEGDPGEASATTAEQPKPVVNVTPPEAPAATPQPSEPAAAPSFADLLSQAPPEYREVLAEGMELRANRRDRLIKALVACDRCDFNEDELKACSTAHLGHLGKLAGFNQPPPMSAAADYSGAAPAVVVSNRSPFMSAPKALKWDQAAAS